MKNNSQPLPQQLLSEPLHHWIAKEMLQMSIFILNTRMVSLPISNKINHWNKNSIVRLAAKSTLFLKIVK